MVPAALQLQEGRVPHSRTFRPLPMSGTGGLWTVGGKRWSVEHDRYDRVLERSGMVVAKVPAVATQLQQCRIIVFSRYRSFTRVLPTAHQSDEPGTAVTAESVFRRFGLGPPYSVHDEPFQ